MAEAPAMDSYQRQEFVRDRRASIDCGESKPRHEMWEARASFQSCRRRRSYAVREKMMIPSTVSQIANALFQIGHIIRLENNPTRRSHVSAGRFDVLDSR